MTKAVVSPTPGRVPLPCPGFLELVGGGLGDGGQLAKALRIIAEAVGRGGADAV